VGSKFHYVIMVFFYWVIFFILLPLVHAYILRFKNMISFCKKKCDKFWIHQDLCKNTCVPNWKDSTTEIFVLKFSLKYWISFMSLKNAFPMFLSIIREFGSLYCWQGTVEEWSLGVKFEGGWIKLCKLYPL